MSLFFDTAEFDWTPPGYFPDIHSGDIVGFDTETKDEGISEGLGSGWPWNGGYVIGASLAWEGGAGYWPVAHAAGGNVPELPVLDYLLALMKREDITLAVANGAYDFGWLAAWARENGRAFLYPRCKVIDVLILAPLLDENRPSYSLDSIGREELGRRKDETLLRKAGELYGYTSHQQIKANMWRLPPPAVGPYAEEDAILTRDLAGPMMGKCPKVMFPAVKLEHDILPVLVKMRTRGVRIDVDQAERLVKDYRGREKAAMERVRQACGFHVDPWDGNRIAQALRVEGIEPPVTPSGAPSITKDLMTVWEAKGSVVAKNVAEGRKWQKAHSTFLSGQILKFAHKCGDEWRTFCEFNPLRAEKEDGAAFGTVSYRFSATAPALQVLPGRDGELTRDIRGCMLPERGEEWGAGDYSQQEPRMGINYAEAIEVAQNAMRARNKFVEHPVHGGIEAANRVRTDQKWDFHNMASEITGIPRKYVKTLSLGRMYAMGDGKMAWKLNMPYTFKSGAGGKQYMIAGPEAMAIITKYDEEMPWVKGMADYANARATEKGYIILLGGYIARFSAKGGRAGDLPHKAFNRLCQGSGGAQTKAAMVEADRQGLNLLVTMHDELGISGDERERALLRESMVSAFASELRVPSKVDMGIGQNWGEAS
jgi:DNA polymerase I-like protein with 3'-5' exonuclease and polymerase domains